MLHPHPIASWPVLPKPVLLAGVLASMWLMLPSLSSVHLEGFTAEMQSIAWLMAMSPGTPHDPHVPLVSQYIYQLKAGCSDLLQLIFRVAPHASDRAFRGLMLASFALLAWASLHCARQWGQVPAVLGWFALMLVPGLPEVSFFFNDNLPSAALAAASLACVAAPKASALRCAAAGALLALAMLCRFDAIFAGPMVLGAALCAPGGASGLKRWAPACWLALSTSLCLLFLAAMHGFSMLDVWVIGRQFTHFLAEHEFSRMVWTRAYFLGLIAAPAWALGLVCIWRECMDPDRVRQTLWRTTFVVYPILLFCFAPKVTESRYILPLLASILTWHVARGLAWTCQALRTDGTPRWLAMVCVVWGCAVLLAPPGVRQMLDGPRALAGRLWSPYFWRQWQEASATSMQKLDALVSSLGDVEQSVVISLQHNDEFYLHLRLIEAGYTPTPVQTALPGCAGFGVMQKGSLTVMHVRTDPKWFIAPVRRHDNVALQMAGAIDCADWKSTSPVYLTTYGTRDVGMLPTVLGLSDDIFQGERIGTFFHWKHHLKLHKTPEFLPKFEYLDHVQLAPEDQARMRAFVRNNMAQQPVLNFRTQQPFTLDEYERIYLMRPGPTQAFWNELGWVRLPQP